MSVAQKRASGIAHNANAIETTPVPEPSSTTVDPRKRSRRFEQYLVRTWAAGQVIPPQPGSYVVSRLSFHSVRMEAPRGQTWTRIDGELELPRQEAIILCQGDNLTAGSGSLTRQDRLVVRGYSSSRQLLKDHVKSEISTQIRPRSRRTFTHPEPKTRASRHPRHLRHQPLHLSSLRLQVRRYKLLGMVITSSLWSVGPRLNFNPSASLLFQRSRFQGSHGLTALGSVKTTGSSSVTRIISSWRTPTSPSR
jgi:hypothetical protein